MTVRRYSLNVNPMQWAIGPVTTIKRGGKTIPMVGRNVQLHNFKEAVKREMDRLYGPQEIMEGPVELRFWFWRNRPAYKNHQQRTHRTHEADVTNMQKSLEDALQGVLYKNDKQTRKVTSETVDQDHDIWGHIIIEIEPYEPSVPPSFYPPRDVDPILADFGKGDDWVAPERVEDYF